MSVGLPSLLIALKVAFGCWLLVTVSIMAVIDCRELILPDSLNALLAVGGIGQAVLIGHPDLTDAVLGATFGFFVLSAIAVLFRRVRGIDGLGFGDQKFSAAAGLWIGWEAIAPMLLIASCSALIFLIIRSAGGWRFDRLVRLPFGPFLGLGTVVCWLVAVAPGS